MYANLTSPDFLSWGEIETILEDNKIILHGHDSIAIHVLLLQNPLNFHNILQSQFSCCNLNK